MDIGNGSKWNTGSFLDNIGGKRSSVLQDLANTFNKNKAALKDVKADQIGKICDFSKMRSKLLLKLDQAAAQASSEANIASSAVFKSVSTELATDLIQDKTGGTVMHARPRSSPDVDPAIVEAVELLRERLAAAAELTTDEILGREALQGFVGDLTLIRDTFAGFGDDTTKEISEFVNDTISILSSFLDENSTTAGVTPRIPGSAYHLELNAAKPRWARVDDQPAMKAFSEKASGKAQSAPAAHANSKETF